jgi:HNH endonuclease
MRLVTESGMDSQPLLGIFVSYNEKNGKFADAVEVCNAREYIIWLDKVAVRKERFLFPSTILIKITGEDRYYRGQLRDVKRADEVDRAALLAEAAHRPAAWREVDKIDYADFKSIFYISGLKQVPRPAGIAKDSAPQHPHYVEEAVLRGQAGSVVPLAEELPSPGNLVEGAVCQVAINAYERNPIARCRCIAHYGPTCMICGFSFDAVYGSLAEGFIHVHHVKPLSEIGEEYVVDPIADLRPVCANCHAIVHLGGGSRGIEEARRLVDPRVQAFWASFVE